MRGIVRLPSRIAGLLGLAACAVAAAAPAEKPAWSGKDLAGRPLQVPAPGQVAILLFIRPEQDQSGRALAELRASLPAGAQAVAVVSGSDAAARARAVAGWDGPIVADETWACSGAFDVHAWPTTVLLNRQGELAGHLPGWSVTYATKLAAYAAFAAGRTTPGQLAAALSEQSVIEESTDQKAAGHLRLAARLIASDRRDDAAAQLRQARALGPAGEKVRLQLARAELLLGQARAADDLLQMLSRKDAAGEAALLRGWAAEALGRWAQAKPLLEQAAASPDSSAEAQYRLGLLYQHGGDAARAAAAFRKAFELTAPGQELVTSPPPPPSRPPS